MNPEYNPWAAPVFPGGAAFGTGSPAETSQQPAGLYDLLSGIYNSVGGLAKRALGESANAVGTGTYNPGPALETALLAMGGGVGGTGGGAGPVLGSGPARMRMIDNVDLYKELANQQRAKGFATGKAAPGHDFKRPDAEKGSWGDLVARTKQQWETDKARAIGGFEDAAPGAVPRSPYMTADDYAEVAKPNFVLGSGSTDKRGAAAIQGIRAYHGSPHDFDRFDLSKIGTGEGAQAYGHGLYFAEKEGTAKAYRDALSRDKDRMLETGGRLPPWVASTIESRNPVAIDDMRKTFQARIAEAEAEAKTSIQPWLYPGKIAGLQDVLKSIDDFERGAAIKPPGRMYEVNINADPAHFLDWDKPLSQQHQKVQGAASQLAGERMNDLLQAQKPYGITNPHDTLTGSELYHGLANPIAAGKILPNAPSDIPIQHIQAQALREAGIPGIKYLDQGSRGAGQGSSNYVVFDDKLIDILRKYAVAGMFAPPIFAGAMSEQKQ